jgi:hypothetical protein
MQNWSGVVPTGFIDAKILRVPDAIIRPPGEGDMQGLRQVCGVFHHDGSPVDMARTVSSSGDLSLPATLSGPPLRRREGAWVFGGMLFHHFGHALIYSMSRIWAVQRLLDGGVPLRGVVFFQRFAPEPQASPALPRNLLPIFDIFPPGLPIVTIADVEQIDELYVPEQGISTAPELFIGRPEQRHFYRNSAARVPPNAERRDIYISRTKTGWKGNHLFEAEIQRAMAEAGYLIFHPQTVSLQEQIATYRSARRIVAVDGSALHVAAMAVPSDAKVAVISRREFYAWAIADQIRAFADCEVQVIEAHADAYVFSRQLGRRASWSTTQVLTDFAKLGHELVQHGFLDRLPEWQFPTEAELGQRLADAKAKFGDDLVRIPDDIRRREPHYGAHRGPLPQTSL